MAKVFTITEGLENMGALKTGGQGSVYKGRRRGEIITAVKLLPTPIHNEDPQDKNFRDFQNEVEKLKKVNQQPNPNVVKILSSGITETGSLPFIEMEYIEGPDLEELLQPPHGSVFTIKETIKVAEQLSHALAHCHKLDIKHGDIKSNNVKFNIHTGNYVLLDFGLAIMSDEQRRTSLRHAGAVEFMAPEQYEGQMLFETDVYSFGIILFELLAGTVPFPLKDRGETARNLIMLAHMEKSPPDLLSLRRAALPAGWSEEKKEREMTVPHWLLDTINKCLEKKPVDRFPNGMALYDHIVVNSMQSSAHRNNPGESMLLLQQENQKLQKQLQQHQEAARNKEAELVALRVSVTQKDRDIQVLRDKLAMQQTQAPQYRPAPPAPRAKGMSSVLFGLLLLVTIGLGVYAAVTLLNGGNSNRKTEPEATETQTPPQRTVIGRYKVAADRAYFHNEPNSATRRSSAYMVPSEEVIDGLDEKNGFVYVEFTNDKGQMSKGWLRREDLMTLDEWNNRATEPQKLTKIEINSQLQNARALADNGNTEEALAIYKTLSEYEVPEAMYEYGNFALKNKNNDIDCATALDLINRASDSNYTPAKTTLGFLYLFADNRDVLHLSNYDRCEYEKNVVKGTKLLMQAVVAGDTTASRILEQHKENSDTTAQ
ncbi:protein kinase [Chitinophagaceae bacterium LB-8]|uniref:Protein kinase n=1 Tax=Paraflavisolibacter caeni TaxID=2982496 RepID=A0A9X2XZY0_9BACT|nr:serine/threonine-protein kinase [Paraflavisolibacter caeni]MCU7552031.1 protein kinase [Paraflavisolibacter caeni]